MTLYKQANKLIIFIIMMDNATFHKRSDIQQAILAAEYLLKLPPYSPDLNPT
ncbi:transposase [Beggiatoa leptomitoformis]|uniref:transposase n=1 Tax=Beggiatoa leptomitoformis TaxID=288004 RepID=UPI000A023766|nr:transposase [Beggiatoa leptomitoformis]